MTSEDELIAAYPTSQRFSAFTAVDGDGRKSYLAFMAGPNNDIPVVFREGVTNPTMLVSVIDSLRYDLPVKLDITWGNFRFDEGRTRIVGADVLRLSVHETINNDPGNIHSLKVQFRERTRVLYDRDGKLEDEGVKVFDSVNPSYYKPPEGY
ncbi:MAG: hypothetical protein PHG85_06750, partial [Candidatus Altiarchaeota archaeon]|nr:hypothetical protein [Candidatus Altiarchaeota archaeon]